MVTARPGRPGRRPGNVDTKAEIVEAARRWFEDKGFNATSIRAVAQEAGVDPALVHHYFHEKADLYIAAMNLPADPKRVSDLVAEDHDGGFGGESLVRHFLAQWELDGDGMGSPSFVAMVQAVASSSEAADSMREFLATRLGPAHFGGDEQAAAFHRSLVSSQLIGLGWARYVLRIEPLASAARADVARWIGPTLDRYVAAEPE